MISEEKADLILEKLDLVLKRLDKHGIEDKEWITASDFRTMVGLKSRAALAYHIRKGVFDHTAIRNISVGHRNTYRFHRVNAVAQFLNRKGALPVAG